MALASAKFSQLITGNTTTSWQPLMGTITASAYKAPGSSTFGATVELQKSMNGGLSGLVLPRNEANDKARYTDDFSFLLREENEGMQFRFVVSNYTGDPIVVEFR